MNQKNNWGFVLFIISFIFTLVGSLFFGINGQPKEMGLAIIAGFFGMVFSNLDKFEYFKGLGMEARMITLVDFHKIINERKNKTIKEIEDIVQDKSISNKIILDLTELTDEMKLISSFSLLGKGLPPGWKKISVDEFFESIGYQKKNDT